MSKVSPTTTAESRLIAAKIKALGITKAAIAKALGLDPSFVSHWASGHRPVPARYARPLAEQLGVAPEQISAAYSDVSGAQLGVLPAAVSPELEVARLQNDVHALNLALASIVVVMTRHRPAEAKDAAAAIRAKVPRKFRDLGLVHELLKTLDNA